MKFTALFSTVLVLGAAAIGGSYYMNGSCCSSDDAAPALVAPAAPAVTVAPAQDSPAALAAPAVGPYPGTTLITPSGKPAFCAKRAIRKQVSGVCSAGFITIVHPAANAGPHFQAVINIGKFHGIICPATPTGSRRV